MAPLFPFLLPLPLPEPPDLAEEPELSEEPLLELLLELLAEPEELAASRQRGSYPLATVKKLQQKVVSQ